jgi:hypothetical protein
MSETTPDDGGDQDFDPTRRRLCADGSCVGLIGDDGRCRVCGRTEAEAAHGEPSVVLDVGGADAAEAAGEGFDTKRRLCDDGNCVGIVGDDGVCRVCGHRAQ